MGTNYYLRTGRKVKKICNLGCEHTIEEELHIGKYSSGWKFCLHIIPENGINELEDWIPLLRSGTIFNEYGMEISFEEMMSCIENPNTCHYRQSNEPYTSYDHTDNRYYCNKDAIGKGGSYVLVKGEFI